MTVPVALLLMYAGAIGWGANHALARARWTDRSPRVAIMLWHGLAAGFLTSLACALALLAHDVVEHTLARLLVADKSLLHSAYAPPQEIPWYWNASLALLFAGLLVLVLAWFRRAQDHRAVATLHRSAVSRVIHVADSNGDSTGVGVVESAAPALYCLANSRSDPRILATRGAVELLPPRLLKAAVAHEHSHLRHGHHLSVLLADVVTSTFQRTGLLSHYRSTIEHLVELEADDDAAARHGRRNVARALLEVCAARAPADVPGSSWTGGSPAARIRRLATKEMPKPRRTTGRFVCACSVLTALSPVAAALLPATLHAGTADDASAISHHNVLASGFVHHE